MPDGRPCGIGVSDSVHPDWIYMREWEYELVMRTYYISVLCLYVQEWGENIWEMESGKKVVHFLQ